jgi:outer membrane usher protein
VVIGFSLVGHADSAGGVGPGSTLDASSTAAASAQTAGGQSEGRRVPGGGRAESYEHLFAAFAVNGKTVSQFTEVLRTQDGRLLVTSDVLRDARLAQLPAPAVVLDGRPYYSLDAVPGAQYKFDEDQQTVSLQVLPSSLSPTIFDSNSRGRYSPTSPGFGAILNHDLQFVQTSTGRQLSALLDAAVFNSLGVLTSDSTTEDLLSGTPTRRLDTRFTREMPGSMRTVVIGDTVSASDTWAQSVHYAGVQIAKNFAEQPSFIPFALPAMQAVAAQPSAVEIYMNNILTMRQSVDAGPFTIQNIPVITPEGDLRMVVTDVTGHQEVLTCSYFSMSTLLRKGVSSYSYDGGIMRWGEGTADDSYHTLFAAGTHRYGISDSLTVDLRGEILATTQTFGGGAEWGVKRAGMVAASFAASHSDAGLGTLVYGALQRRTSGWQMGGSLQLASPTFRQLGLLPGQLAARMLAQAQVGRSLGRRASLAAGYLLSECQGPVDCTAQLRHLSATTVSFGMQLGHWGTLGNTLSYSPGQAGTTFVISLAIPLQHRRHLMSSASGSRDDKSGMVDFEETVPNGRGFGYRARFNSDNTDAAGGLDYGNRYGTYSFAAERSGLGSEYSAEERSGIVFLGGDIMPTRWLDNSFALVDVPGQPGIRVYANNQYIATTDWRGKAVVPVVPFDANAVRLDDKDVPVQLAMDLAERNVVPFSRTGVLVRFSAEVTKGATVILRAPDGSFLPLGSQVTVAGSTEVYEVAYDGEVFIQDLVTPAQLHVHGPKFECDASVPKAPAGVDLPRIGPVTCEPK